MPYPDSFDSFRAIENIPGVSFDSDDKRTLFSEDVDAITSAIQRIQSTLGLNPEGNAGTVAGRLLNIGIWTDLQVSNLPSYVPNWFEYQRVFISNQAQPFTLAVPDDLPYGSSIAVYLQDNGTSRDLSFDSDYLWPEGNEPPVATTPWAILEFIIVRHPSRNLISWTEYQF